MSFLSPVPEHAIPNSLSNNTSNTTGNSRASRSGSHQKKRLVANFHATLAELKAKQKVVQEKFNAAANIDCELNAIPHSIFRGQKQIPNDADLKLLENTFLPDIDESSGSTKDPSEDEDIRDEEYDQIFNHERRTDSPGKSDNDFYENEDELDDIEIPQAVFSLEMDNDEVSRFGLDTVAGISERNHLDKKDDHNLKNHGKMIRGRIDISASIKKPFKKIKKSTKKVAKKVWKKIKPIFCKTKQVFVKPDQPQLERARGELT